MVGFSGAMKALQDSGILDCATYVGGLSGSSWYDQSREKFVLYLFTTKTCENVRLTSTHFYPCTQLSALPLKYWIFATFALANDLRRINVIIARPTFLGDVSAMSILPGISARSTHTMIFRYTAWTHRTAKSGITSNQVRFGFYVRICL